MALLDDVKLALRISTSALDDEVSDLIDEAVADLQLSGLVKVETDDPLIKRAIKTYAKANFGLNNPDSEKLQQAYDSLKSHLSLSADYSYFAVVFTVSDGTDPIDEASVEFNGETQLTGTAGTAKFYIRAGTNLEYTVTADGYVSETGNFDVSADVDKSIAMTAG
jgi:uncharacterized phage protein (predicted DNA packaging)